MNAFVGAYNSESTSNGAVLRTCEERVSSPSYIPQRIDSTTGAIIPGTGVLGGNDLALCRLNATVAIDTTSVYLKLNDDDNLNAVNQTLSVMGFGYTSSNRTNPADVLQEVELPVYDETSCNTIYSGLITDTMMCAWDETEETAECGGDSGSPLVLPEVQPDGRSRHTAFGVVSFSTRVCGEFPGVFARISSGIDFIRENVCTTWDLAGSFCPSTQPSNQPSEFPSASPSDAPSARPSNTPSGRPTTAPSNQPSGSPIVSPSSSPSDFPSTSPSDAPSGKPSRVPTGSPSASPTAAPSSSPSDRPSAQSLKSPKKKLNAKSKNSKKKSKTEESLKSEKKTKQDKESKKEGKENKSEKSLESLEKDSKLTKDSKSEKSLKIHLRRQIDNIPVDRSANSTGINI